MSLQQGGKATRWGPIMLGKADFHARRTQLGPYLTPHIKINSKDRPQRKSETLRVSEADRRGLAMASDLAVVSWV